MSQDNKKLGILKEILGSYKKVGGEYLFQCPRPTCEPNKLKLSVNTHKDLFHCWICGWGGRSLYRIVKNYGNDLSRLKWKSFDHYVDLSAFEEIVYGLPNETIHSVPINIELPSDFTSLTSKELWDKNGRPVKYLKNRGLTFQDVLDWRLGFSFKDPKYGGRIIAPSVDLDGNINFFVGRTFVNHWLRYENAITSKNIIFNHLHIDWDEDVVLVEGVFDAMKAGRNSIPLLGSSLKEHLILFQEIVKHDARVFVALDPDARKKQVQLINKLHQYDIELYDITVPNGFDVGDLTKEQFQTLKEKALKIDSSNIFQYNLINKLKELNV